MPNKFLRNIAVNHILFNYEHILYANGLSWGWRTSEVQFSNECPSKVYIAKSNTGSMDDNYFKMINQIFNRLTKFTLVVK